jgi:hypothetical protein
MKIRRAFALELTSPRTNLIVLVIWGDPPGSRCGRAPRVTQLTARGWINPLRLLAAYLSQRRLWPKSPVTRCLAVSGLLYSLPFCESYRGKLHTALSFRYASINREDLVKNVRVGWNL